MATILFKNDTTAIKNPRHMKKNVFIIYSPKDVKVELGSYRRMDIEVAVFLSPNSNGFITSRFNGDELKEVFEGKHHFWIEILNRSFEDNIVVKKNKPVGFLVIEPENLKFHYAQAMKKKNKTKKR